MRRSCREGVPGEGRGGPAQIWDGPHLGPGACPRTCSPRSGQDRDEDRKARGSELGAGLVSWTIGLVELGVRLRVMAGARIRIKSWVRPKWDIAKAGSGVRLGHHYQADSAPAGETIAHTVGWVTGARPLTISCAFAHRIGAAASIILAQGQERDFSSSQDCSAPTSPGKGARKTPVQHPRPPKAVSY